MKTKLCRISGCYRRAVDGMNCCFEHSDREREFQYRRPQRRKSAEWHSLYNSARWRGISKRFLVRYPYCFICGAPATVADHVIPHRGDMNLFYDEENLQPLCTRHHNAKTLRENNYHKPGRG